MKIQQASYSTKDMNIIQNDEFQRNQKSFEFKTNINQQSMSINNHKNKKMILYVVLITLVIVVLIQIIAIKNLVEQILRQKQQNNENKVMVNQIFKQIQTNNQSKTLNQYFSQSPQIYSNNGQFQLFAQKQISECQNKLSAYQKNLQSTLIESKRQIQQNTHTKIAKIQSISNNILMSSKQFIVQYNQDFKKSHQKFQKQMNQANQKKIKTCRETMESIGEAHSKKATRILLNKPQITLFNSNQKTNSKLYLPTYEQLQNMTSNKNLILFTIVKQQSYLQNLYKYISRYRSQFYQWHLWVTNKTLQHTLQYIYILEEQNYWIKVIKLQQEQSIKYELIYLHRMDNLTNKIYLKIDQKIIWIQNNFIQIIFKYRFKLTNHLFVMPNIVNNGVVNHIQQKLGIISNKKIFDYNSDGNSMWDDTIVASIHTDFINSIQKNETSKWKSFKQWELFFYQKVDLQVFMYYSDTFSSLDFIIEKDYNYLYSSVYTKRYKLPGTIISQPIFSYQCGESQRVFLGQQFPQIFKKYRQIASKL